MQAITASVTDEQVRASSPLLVPWWSYSKTIVAAAALLLVEQGRLSLDEPLYGKPYSLRQLLQHRSGVGDYGFVDAYHAAVAAGDSPWPVEDMLRRSHACTLLFAPGEGWSYSNIGYTFVRQLIERTTDLSLGQALTRLVFEPLAVADAFVAVTRDDLAVAAWERMHSYDPGWVYHGLVAGPALSAALLLHRLMHHSPLTKSSLRAMLTMHDLGVANSDRPWQRPASGLGLFRGSVGQTDFVGHTGVGPGSASAIYTTMPGSTSPIRTLAAFTPREDPADVERLALAIVKT
jgi:CubicO group peptidase (beta-lactamase class C family)